MKAFDTLLASVLIQGDPFLVSHLATRSDTYPNQNVHFFPPLSISVCLSHSLSLIQPLPFKYPSPSVPPSLCPFISPSVCPYICIY